ncbi:MAG: hypothetical protein K9W44_16140 [Candidatus Lokiarchaeota archaeon]|nr:hypothetical protein [Candidatus Harpocratesius repetitus]
MSLIKAENIRLKKKVEDLENRLINLVGAIKIFATGMSDNELEMNNHIAEIISSGSELKIVAPYISEEYAILLQDRSNSGIKMQIVVNDRRLWPKNYQSIYDKLKNASTIDVINNPNVHYLMVWSPETTIFTSGPLSKEHLMKSILIGTIITEPAKNRDMLKIFNLMLPSFMRQNFN